MCHPINETAGAEVIVHTGRRPGSALNHIQRTLNTLRRTCHPTGVLAETGRLHTIDV